MISRAFAELVQQSIIMSDIESNAAIAPCLTVIMPVYNEAATVKAIISDVLAQRPVLQLVVVDDASTDGSWEMLKQAASADSRILLIRQPHNQGKGSALRAGFASVTSPIAIIQDADLEYDRTEYHRLLLPILAGKADVVFGSRLAGADKAHRVLYYWHSVGNKLLTTFSNMATDLNLTDMECGYKAFRSEIIQKITLRENGFGFEPEITAKVARLKMRIYEVSVSYHGRTYAEGKKIGWQDGFHALWCILNYAVLRGE
jgi:glycosyltransferase involved in cell wall biosynthesis